MGERITVGQYNQAILRGFHEGLTMTQLTRVFDCSLETVESTIRKSLIKQPDTTGIQA